MDRRERAADPQEAIRAALDGRQTRIWTALPGIVQSFDPATLTATVQPAIQGRIADRDGVVSLVDLPLLVDCPVQFPAGGGVSLTFPVEAGDECLVVFASRCIDAWWQSGGVQPPLEARMHDLSDGFVVLGFRSQPRVLSPAPSTTAAVLRSDDGTTVVALDPEAQTLVLTAPGGATITAATTINGTLHVTGKITTDDDVEASGDVKAGAISLATHLHGGVTTGGGQTGGPL